MKQFTQPHRSLWWFLRHCVRWSAVFAWIIWPACVYISIAVVFFMLICCSTPKAIENHHHHYEQADTLAIQAQVDKQLKSWHEQMDSSWRQSWQEYSASLFSNEDQKEKVTETITTWTDSLGREMRQEQRTTERSLSRMQQQTEQRLSREFEIRLSTALDSVNDIWQQRFERYQTHWEQTDSTDSHVQSGSAAFGELPWYKRWWQTLKDYLLIAGIIALLVMTRRIWWPCCKKLFRI
jgi:Skp family chaperone for outer membrane proteins